MKGAAMSELQPELGPPVDGAAFSASVRALLDEDPRRYRNFGPYWFFVKALLKRHFDIHDMPILGEYADESVSERIPLAARASGQAMLDAAAREYIQNATFNLGRNEVSDDNGEAFWLQDTDVEG